MASSPSRNLGGGDWNTADLAALFTSSSPVDLPFWFVPCAQEPQAGQKVTVLGYGGKVSEHWAAEYLWTEEDGLSGKSVLDLDVASKRLVNLRETAIHEDFLTASPGLVNAFDGSTREVVEHTCSVMPCISGAAGVDMQEPWKVLFYHLQSQRGTERRYSYGVSVLHPVHAFMYLTHVLPRLNALPPEAFILRRGQTLVDLYPLINDYIKLFENDWQKWGVQQIVLSFQQRHQ